MKGSIINHSLERMVEVSSSNHHQSEDDEVELRKSKMNKMNKIFGLNFLIYLLKMNFKLTLRQCLVQKLPIRRR
jgi:hypothetical protein